MYKHKLPSNVLLPRFFSFRFLVQTIGSFPPSANNQPAKEHIALNNLGKELIKNSFGLESFSISFLLLLRLRHHCLLALAFPLICLLLLHHHVSLVELSLESEREREVKCFLEEGAFRAQIFYRILHHPLGVRKNCTNKQTNKQQQSSNAQMALYA